MSGHASNPTPDLCVPIRNAEIGNTPGSAHSILEKIGRQWGCKPELSYGGQHTAGEMVTRAKGVCSQSTVSAF